jgi:hypothetical protein
MEKRYSSNVMPSGVIFGDKIALLTRQFAYFSVSRNMFLATAAVIVYFLISTLKSVSAQSTEARGLPDDAVSELIERTRSFSASQLSNDIIAELRSLINERWNCQSTGMPTKIKGEMVRLA